LEARGPERRTALAFAALGGSRAAVETLLAAGARPGARDLDGRTAAMLASEAQSPEIAALLE
jgi:ankyrin repeat protein